MECHGGGRGQVRLFFFSALPTLPLGGGCVRDVLEWPYAVGGEVGVPDGMSHRAGTPLPTPPFPPPPLLPFRCLRLTVKILLRRLRCQEDLIFKKFWPTFGGDRRGTLGGGGGVPAKPLGCLPAFFKMVRASF